VVAVLLVAFLPIKATNSLIMGKMSTHNPWIILVARQEIV
jgi:hypothetical protein